jgi:hypothetical protein
MNTFILKPINHLKYSWISLMFLLMVPCVSIFTGDLDILTFIILWAFSGLFYFWGLKLHYTYFKLDRYKSITIDEALNVTISNNLDINSFCLDELDCIINIHSGLQNRTPWNEYNFSIFKLKNGQKFTITCLILDLEEIEKYFPKEVILKRNVFYTSFKIKN